MTEGIIYGKDKKVGGWWKIPSLEVVISDYAHGLFYIQKKYDRIVAKGHKVHNEDALRKLGVKIKKTNMQKKFAI